MSGFTAIPGAFNNITRGRGLFLGKFFTKTKPYLPLGAGIAGGFRAYHTGWLQGSGGGGEHWFENDRFMWPGAAFMVSQLGGN